MTRLLLRRGPGRRLLLGLAASVACLDLLAAAAKLPSVLRIGYEHATAPSRLVRDADLDPFASFAPTAAVVAARKTIPLDATYAIVVGEDIAPELVRQIFQFWLLPRTYTSEARHAEWVIAYHHASETAGVRYTREVGLGPAVNALEVAR